MNAEKLKRKKQVTSLYTSMILGVIVGIGVSVINTRFLGPQIYGDLKFIQSIFSFTLTFLTVGIFVTGSRMLAQDKNILFRDVITGSLLYLAAIVSIFMTLVIFIFSFFEEALFDNNLANIIRIFSPLLFIFPFQICLENILQGRNKIYELSVLRLFPQLLYMIAAFTFNYYFPLNLNSALALQFTLFGLVIIVMVIALKPDFKSIKKYSSLIWKENRTYGLQVYFGSIAGVATAQLGILSIAYFIDNTNVGFYALALTITMPLKMVPSVVGITFFKDFANTDAIMKSTVVMTVVLSLLALLVFLVVLEELIILLYSEDYLEVVSLAYIIAIGSVFHGFGDFINRFLGAHGLGVEMRNGAIAVGMSNVIGFSVLVMHYGVNGASMTKLISGVVYFLVMLLYYRKYQGNKQRLKI